METMLWLFPIFFMLHEMEEIIGFRLWLNRNKSLVTKYPSLSKIYKNFSTEGFAVAVLEEYLLCLLITGASIYFKSYIVWLGAFIAFTLHLVAHLIQGLVLRRYIPTLFSSLILLPFCSIIIVRIIESFSYKPSIILISSLLAILAMLLNLAFVHKVMAKITKIIEAYQKKQI